MVSGFIDEHNGYLALTQEEYNRVKVSNSSTQQQARDFLEYKEAQERYWSSENFMVQIEMAVRIAEVKYPKEKGWPHVWISDHSAMAEDSLDVKKMNVNPGGKQPIMHDGWWRHKAGCHGNSVPSVAMW